MSVTTICSVCHQELSLSGWLDEFMEQYRRLSRPYCPACYRQIMERLQAEANTGTWRGRERLVAELSGPGRPWRQG